MKRHRIVSQISMILLRSLGFLKILDFDLSQEAFVNTRDVVVLTRINVLYQLICSRIVLRSSFWRKWSEKVKVRKI